MKKARAKCVVVGDSATGKSALLSMIMTKGQHFERDYDMV